LSESASDRNSFHASSTAAIGGAQKSNISIHSICPQFHAHTTAGSLASLEFCKVRMKFTFKPMIYLYHAPHPVAYYSSSSPSIYYINTYYCVYVLERRRHIVTADALFLFLFFFFFFFFFFYLFLYFIYLYEYCVDWLIDNWLTVLYFDLFILLYFTLRLSYWAACVLSIHNKRILYCIEFICIRPRGPVTYQQPKHAEICAVYFSMKTSAIDLKL